MGAAELTLSIPHAHSLKEKRKVVRSLIERLRHRFNCAVAEVGDNDEHQRARIGITAVGNDGAFVNSMLDKAIDFLEEDAIGRAHLIDTRLELVHL